MTELELAVEALKRCVDSETYTAALEAVKSEQRGVAFSRKDRVGILLGDLGVSKHLRGYRYLVDAINIALDDRSALDCITKRIYPEIAKDHGLSGWKSVEKAIRNAIERSWDRGDVAVQNRIFQSTISPRRGRPATHEFLSAVVAELEK